MRHFWIYLTLDSYELCKKNTFDMLCSSFFWEIYFRNTFRSDNYLKQKRM
jgi:hypothetical protein